MFIVAGRLFEKFWALRDFEAEVSPVTLIKKPQSVPALVEPSRRSLFLLGCVLVLATVLSYSNTFDVPFLFDDGPRIEDNALIRQLWPISIPMENSNRPLGMVTFAVNYALHGYQVWGYHATNLAIHILSGLTLFGVVRRTLSRSRFANTLQFSATSLAFAIALLWLVHPLNVQAVTYIVQRLESLMGLCYLATLYCFIRAQDSPRQTLWYTASIVCCAAGMGIKEVMVTAPLMVVWYDRVFVSKSWRALFRDHRSYYLGLFSTWSILVWCMLRTQIEYSTGNIAFVKGLTPLSYLLSEAGVVAHYLRLSIWPYGQCLDYGWPVAKTADKIIPPALFLGFLFLATVWAIFRHPPWGFLGGWFFVILAPTSSVVPIIDLAFEQRMYLPLAAVMAVLVLLLALAINYLARRHSISLPHLRLVAGCLAGVVAVQMVVLTWARNEVFRSEVGIWEDAVAKAPGSARVHNNLGNALFWHGDLEGAAEECRHAIHLDRNFAEAYNGLGNVLRSQGKFDIAIEQYRQAISIKPDYASAYSNLGNALQNEGRYDAAIEQYREAIRLKPHYAEAYSNLACALLHQQQYELAEQTCRQAIRLGPNADAYNNLGNSLHGQGKTDAAIEQYQQAIRCKPDFAPAYYNRSIAYLKLRRYDKAWDDIRVCRQLGMTPNSAHLDALISASGHSE